MAKNNRSINEPGQRCQCGGKAFCSGGMRILQVECSRCGVCTTGQHITSEAACNAWDRGERMSQDAYMQQNLSPSEYKYWKNKVDEAN